MKASIRFKILIMSIVLITLPLVALGVNSYLNSVEVLKDNLRLSTEQLIAQTEESINNYMEGYKNSVVLMSKNASVQTVLEKPEVISSATSEVIQETEESTHIDPMALQWMMKGFKSYIDSHHEVMNIYLGTKNSDMLLYPEAELPEGFDPVQRPWYQEAVKAGGFIWTEPYVDATSGTLIITAAIPVYNEEKNNEFIGVLGIDLSLNTLADRINTITIGKKGYPVILDSQYNIMTHKDKELIGKPLPVEELLKAVEAMDSGDIEYVMEEEGVMVEKIGVFKKFDKLGWTILVAMYVDEISDSLNFLINNTLMIGGGALLLAIIASYIFSNRLTKEIKELAKYMDKIKQGDFTVKFNTKAKDEIGKLAEGFNVMIHEIGNLVKNVRDMSEEVTTATESLAATSEETSASAEEVVRTVDEIAKGASEQASEAEKGAVMTANLASKFEELSKNTKEMLNSADEAIDANLKGINVMEDLQSKSKLNDEATRRIEGAIIELDSKTKHIGNILDTISSIAEQTNLLALNASIEAARAGEHGRGFAVVADEIRKLAENSRDAADEIKDIVVNIQNDSSNTVSIMGEVKERSTEQGRVVENVHESFETISKSIEKIVNKIKDINEFVSQMNQDKDKIVSAIENISAVSEETAAASEEVSASMQQQSVAIDEVARAADNLNGLILKLNEHINKFKI